jgi:hypothetical protein
VTITNQLHRDWSFLRSRRPLSYSKIFKTFYGTRMSFIIFTTARHCSPPWARLIQSISPYLIFLTSILILSTHLRLDPPSNFFPSGSLVVTRDVGGMTELCWPNGSVIIQWWWFSVVCLSVYSNHKEQILTTEYRGSIEHKSDPPSPSNNSDKMHPSTLVSFLKTNLI